MLIGHDIKKAYGGKAVLQGAGIQVSPGQISALIGPSGAGKSTLLREMAFVEPPDEGRIEIDGRSFEYPADRDKNPSVWPSVTVVFQRLHLWPNMTVRDNIIMPVRERSNGRQWADDVDRLVADFGMEEFIDRYPNEVSVGQAQRAAIARALLLKPRYLLLDEVTSSLDVEHVSNLLRYLIELRATGETGILLITHLLGFAKRSADQVFFMDNGKIVEQGGPDVLSAPGNERLARFLSLMQDAS